MCATKPGLDRPGLHVPQFLDADAVHLRIQPVELQAVHHILGQRSARPFGEHRDFRAQLVAGREVVFRLAVLVHALVFGEDSGDAVLLVEQFPARELREQVDAFFLDQPAQPFHKFVQRDDVISVVLQRRRRDRQLERAFSVK